MTKIKFADFIISKIGYIVMCIMMQKHYIHSSILVQSQSKLAEPIK